jgi:hypothetical protein
VRDVDSQTLAEQPSPIAYRASLEMYCFVSHHQGTVPRSSNIMTSITPYICTSCTRQLKKRAAFKSQRLSALFHTFNRRYSSKHIPQDGRPFRMAVIGSGPAGFYTAYKVMSKIDNAIVDMYEQLPTPYGLVRYGVAPDHPEVKVWTALLRQWLHTYRTTCRIAKTNSLKSQNRRTSTS